MQILMKLPDAYLYKDLSLKHTRNVRNLYNKSSKFGFYLHGSLYLITVSVRKAPPQTSSWFYRASYHLQKSGREANICGFSTPDK